jgi:DNA-binding MarR family transcriptional regulator
MAADPARKRKPRLTAAMKSGVRPASLDRVIHERVRLGIVSALAGAPVMSFIELKAALGLTDGNLSVHARRLEEAGYIECKKGFEGRVPRTEFRLTAKGRAALDRYLGHMEALLRTLRDR